MSGHAIREVLLIQDGQYSKHSDEQIKYTIYMQGASLPEGWVASFTRELTAANITVLEGQNLQPANGRLEIKIGCGNISQAAEMVRAVRDRYLSVIMPKVKPVEAT